MSTSTPIIIGGAFIPPVIQTLSEEEKLLKEQKREERLNKLIERVSKASPIGKKIVESAIERGIGICFEEGCDNALGKYVPSVKCVVLNEKFPDEKLLSTIIHECRHSEQKPVKDHTYTILAGARENRALEADAMAHECAAVYQMRKSEPETYNVFKQRHAGIMTAYESSFEKEKDEKKAKSEAFKAWYDDAAYVELYDRSIVEFMATGSMYSGGYKKDMPSEKLLDNVDYVEKSFFDSKRAMTFSEKVARETQKAERGHIRHIFNIFGKSKIKTSADDMYVRQQDGSVSSPKNMKNNVINKVLMSEFGR